MSKNENKNKTHCGLKKQSVISVILNNCLNEE